MKRFAIHAVAMAMLLCGGLRLTSAQEASGLQAAVAIEQAMIGAIAEAEKSIVAIALVSARGDMAREPRIELFPPFNQGMMVGQQNGPTDPDFVPNEYATGVIIDPSGLVLTNFHAVGRDTKRYELYITTGDRKVYNAIVMAGDDKSDLALLQIVNPSPGTKFQAIKFGDAKKLKKGQIVITLGNPYAIARDGQPSASWGIISNLSRKLGTEATTEEQRTLHHYGTLIQTDAKLNLGTSGGALINLHGEMVGLTTSLAATTGYEQSAGYAIPIDEGFRSKIEDLKQGREISYGFLGIMPQNLRPDEIAQGMVGTRVNHVSAGTPAQRGELATHDIITHVNGDPIYDAAGLRLAIGLIEPEAKATFSVIRNGQKRELEIVLSKGPNPGAKVVTTPLPSWRGLRVDYPTALFPRPPISEAVNAEGVAVSEVDDYAGTAGQAGLHRGMLITGVEGVPVKNPEEFHREVARHTGEVVLEISTAPGRKESKTVAE